MNVGNIDCLLKPTLKNCVEFVNLDQNISLTLCVMLLGLGLVQN